jgi:hypothetical protein
LVAAFSALSAHSSKSAGARLHHCACAREGASTTQQAAAPTSNARVAITDDFPRALISSGTLLNSASKLLRSDSTRRNFRQLSPLSLRSSPPKTAAFRAGVAGFVLACDDKDTVVAGGNAFHCAPTLSGGG